MTPDQFTRKELMLDVGDGHQLYVQLWGSPVAKKTYVFLHGGPGSGCNDYHKSLFDPTHHQVVFFDQRGSGKSVPKGSLVANDTDHLVADINTITEELGIDTFAITGGSWGSTLALAYAVRFPKKVTNMVLRGIFTGRQQEIDFLEKGGARAFYPDAWERFTQSVPAKFVDEPMAYHEPRILGSNAEEAKQSAYAYSHLEKAVLGLDDRQSVPDYETFDPTGTIIECHFTSNRCFMPDNYLLDEAKKLTMPVRLIQGRYDAICPPMTAYELSKRLPDGQLFWTVAGHSGNDRANWDLTRSLLSE